MRDDRERLLDIDVAVVWTAVEHDLPFLKQEVTAMLAAMP